MINVVFNDHVNGLHWFRHWRVSRLKYWIANLQDCVSSWKEFEEVKKPLCALEFEW